MSVRRARREVPRREFLRWQFFLALEEEDKVRREWGETQKWEHYLAAIKFWVYTLLRRVDGLFSKTNFPSRDADDFLIKFNLQEESKAAKTIAGRAKLKDEVVEVNGKGMSRQELESRNAWSAFLGVDLVNEDKYGEPIFPLTVKELPDGTAGDRPESHP